MFEGETKANVTWLVPHGLTPYRPASDPQVGALLAVAELRLKSKGDPPPLAIRAIRDDPPGTLRRAASVVQITPQTPTSKSQLLLRLQEIPRLIPFVLTKTRKQLLYTALHSPEEKQEKYRKQQRVELLPKGSACVAMTAVFIRTGFLH